MSSNSIPDPWRSFFTEIDVDLTEQVSLHCLGGFAMTMVYRLERLTADVDVLPVASNSAIGHVMHLAGPGSELHKKYKIYLMRVN